MTFLEQKACEDLKAFERRLMEIVSCTQPTANRWRLVLFISSLLTSYGAFHWLMDPLTSQINLTQSLLNHLFFTINALILISLFLIGVHKRVVAPQIIASRIRQVLTDFNMSCDENGRLILKPRPTFR